jgi:hypothetical protein
MQKAYGKGQMSSICTLPRRRRRIAAQAYLCNDDMGHGAGGVIGNHVDLLPHPLQLTRISCKMRNLLFHVGVVKLHWRVPQYPMSCISLYGRNSSGNS